MRFLSFSECANWCVERGIAAPKDYYGYELPEITERDFHFVAMPYNVDSGRKVACARHLFSLIEPSSEMLLWLRDWSVWPSSQHMPLFERFRQALGEQRPLTESPGHLVSALDADDGISIVATSLFFFWDCFGISTSGRDAFKISHDEYCWFASRDPAIAAKVKQRLEGT